MQEKATELGEAKDGIRVLDTRGLIFHNAHVKKGTRVAGKKCPFCKSGVDGLVSKYEEKVSKPDVVQDNGADEEGTTAPAPASWWNPRDEPELQD